MKSRAFTLIELLVVVLIIGILAAIALPQYGKAVKRSRGREVLLHIRALNQIFALNALANYNMCADNLCLNRADIELPTLKYFNFENDGLLNHAQEYVEYVAKNARVKAAWARTTGRPTGTACTGTECAAYFGCNTTTETTCDGNPWDGVSSCPEQYIGETTSCNL